MARTPAADIVEEARRLLAGCAQAIQQAIDQAGKSLRWKARARPGRRSPWYELPEEVAGTRHG